MIELDKYAPTSFWYPVYAVRKIADIDTALSEIMTRLCRGEKIEVYTTEEKAREEAASRLVDDDSMGACEVQVFKEGYIDIYPVSKYSCWNSFHVFCPDMIEKIEVVE